MRYGASWLESTGRLSGLECVLAPVFGNALVGFIGVYLITLYNYSYRFCVHIKYNKKKNEIQLYILKK